MLELSKLDNTELAGLANGVFVCSLPSAAVVVVAVVTAGELISSSVDARTPMSERAFLSFEQSPSHCKMLSSSSISSGVALLEEFPSSTTPARNSSSNQIRSRLGFVFPCVSEAGGPVL